MVVPLFVGRAEVDRGARRSDERRRAPAARGPAPDRPAKTRRRAISTRSGRSARSSSYVPLPDGTVKVLVEGKQRARIDRFVQPAPFFCCEVDADRGRRRPRRRVEALMRSVRSTLREYVKLNRKIPPEVLNSVQQIQSASRLADTVAAHLIAEARGTPGCSRSMIRGRAPRRGLRTAPGRDRGPRGRGQDPHARQEADGTHQKEYYLNEQMRAIQKELGERDEFKNEIHELEAALANEEARRRTRRTREEGDSSKLKMMSPMSAEATVVRNYIDWMLALPWNEHNGREEATSSIRADPRRGPLRPREAQGTHPRVPRGPDARREAEGPDPVPRRSAGRRQDVARQSRSRARPVASSCACRSAACATKRRSAATAAPTSVRCRARSSSPAQGGHLEPGLPARRDRQDVDGLPRRSRVGAARGARPRAEPHLQRSLSRRRLRPVAT